MEICSNTGSVSILEANHSKKVQHSYIKLNYIKIAKCERTLAFMPLHFLTEFFLFSYIIQGSFDNTV